MPDPKNPSLTSNPTEIEFVIVEESSFVLSYPLERETPLVKVSYIFYEPEATFYQDPLVTSYWLTISLVPNTAIPHMCK